VGQALFLVHIDFNVYCLIASNMTKERVDLK